jgi:tetratricopeptide (TPR) repeat protein
MASRDAEPYVGGQPFGIEDAGAFFGRSVEASEARTLALSSRLLVIHGRSGVGKTSLLNAGMLAGLDANTAQVLPVGRPARISAFPTTATPVYNPYTVELLSSLAPDQATSRLQGLTIAEFLERVPTSVDRYDDELPLVVVIDQFEEVFRDVPEWAEHRSAFLRQLGEAVDRIDRLRLVLLMTDDIMGDFLPFETVLSGGGMGSRLHVEPLTVDAAHDAVARPLEGTGRSFAPGAAEELVDRLRTTTITNALGDRRTITSPQVEPLNLQVVCQALWRALPDDVTVITTGDLGDYGDVQTALTTYCVNAVVEVAEQVSVPEPKVWEWLERSFITDLGTRGAAYEGILYTAGMPNAVAWAFEAQRILRSEKRSGSVWFELVHDGLIEAIRNGRRMAEGFDVDAVPLTVQDIYLRMAEAALRDNMLPLAEHYASNAINTSEGDQRTLAEAATFLGKVDTNLARGAVDDQAAALYETAEGHFRRAIELYETGQNFLAAGRVFAQLGNLFLERRRFPDAVEALRNAVQRVPSDADVRMDLARARDAMGHAPAALGDYMVVLNLKPDHVEALVARGLYYVAHGDPALGLEDLEYAIRLHGPVAERPDVKAARAQARTTLERRQ